MINIRVTILIIQFLTKTIPLRKHYKIDMMTSFLLMKTTFSAEGKHISQSTKLNKTNIH